MAYYVGDIPSEDIVIEPARNGEPIDLTSFDSADVTLYDETGELVITPGFIATIADDTVSIEWPGTSPFENPGMYSMRVILESTGGPRERLAPLYFVVQADDGWMTIDALTEDWSDARALPDRTLHILLETAKAEVLAWGRSLDLGALPPINYVKAQGDQARNKLNASKVDPQSGGFGDESFIVKPFPLDWAIQQTIRPKKAKPVIV